MVTKNLPISNLSLQVLEPAFNSIVLAYIKHTYMYATILILPKPQTAYFMEMLSTICISKEVIRYVRL